MQIVSYNIEKELRIENDLLHTQLKQFLDECKILRQDNLEMENEVEIIGREMFKVK